MQVLYNFNLVKINYHNIANSRLLL